MKTFSAAKNKDLDRSSAMALAGLNLFATPGLGTLLAGRILPGLIQLTFATAGFVLICLWFLALFRTLIDPQAGSGPAWEWQVGLFLFGVGWLGAAWSSRVIVQKAKSVAIPPKLNGGPN